MNDDYEINTKFYGFEGILGRRDYCINLVYISVIMFFVNFPILVYLFTKILSFNEILKYNEIFYGAPILLIFVSILCSVAPGIIMISNIHRRLTDILGRKSVFLTSIFGIIILISCLWFLFPSAISSKIYWLSLVLYLFLIFMPGSITSKLPYDYTKGFNWGAFLGTWMWGLYNKSYVTLFQWALGSTPFGFIFKIYCGLKGNEWAYKGRKYDDVEKFNKSQRRQTVFFVLWNFIIFPFLVSLPFILISVYALTFHDYCSKCEVKSVTKPPVVKQIDKPKEKIDLDNMYKFAANIYFVSYQFTDSESKFYIDTDEWKWKKLSIFDKFDIMDKALKISKGYRLKENRIKHPDRCPAVNNTDEMRKIKIYSAKTGQLIGEYNSSIDTQELTLKSALLGAMNIWKFYNLEE